MNKCALLLIEFQHEWLSPKGKLHSMMQDVNAFTESVENAKNILEAARRTELTIIHSGLSFQAQYPELGKAKYGLRAVIPQRQTFSALSIGSEFVEPFVPQHNEFIVKGRSGSSAFAGSNLDSFLRHNQISTLYIMGYAMHVCVESTIRAAHDSGYDAILIEDASAAFMQAQKEHVLNEVIHHFGDKITTKEFLNKLGVAYE